MTGFLIKKTLFDLWDNLFKIALLNLGFTLSAAFFLFLPSLLAPVPPLAAAAVPLGLFWVFVYLAAAAGTVKTLADYGSFGAGDFFRCLKGALPAGAVLGFFACLIWVTANLGIPFYLALNSPPGLLLAALSFWILLSALLTLQFFPAVRARLDPRTGRALKKSFLIFIDNPGFCFFSLASILFLSVLSILCLLLIPGPVGILLYLDEALRLRLLKYDWLEANPGADRRKIPWDTLLAEDREKTGNRSFKSFIFPWKE
ncbi:MAG: hypothetical protein LBD31_01235 [Treponema sp.]|jgi:hypothetical protein|nr:hypothetical protein [Treponema sp.]